jgi:hypothetical protein
MGIIYIRIAYQPMPVNALINMLKYLTDMLKISV